MVWQDGAHGCFDGEYHDLVWGKPVSDSKELFAQMSLASQQAGVSWRIVWNKSEHYRAAFHGFDMHRVAVMTDAEMDDLVDRSGQWAGKLMQNRNKLQAIVHNAKLCVDIEDSHPGGLSGFFWSFVRGREDVTINSHERDSSEYDRTFGQTSEFSDAMEQELKKRRGFKFLGSITLQAFMLQCGLLNGHCPRCPCNPRSRSAAVEQVCTPVSNGKKRQRASEAASQARVRKIRL